MPSLARIFQSVTDFHSAAWVSIFDTLFFSKIASRGRVEYCLKGKLHSKIINSEIFSAESDGKGSRPKFDHEDGQTDCEKLA